MKISRFANDGVLRDRADWPAPAGGRTEESGLLFLNPVPLLFNSPASIRALAQGVFLFLLYQIRAWILEH